MRPFIQHGLFPALVGGAVGLLIVVLLNQNQPGSEASEDPARSAKPGYAAAVRRAAPAVVNIYSSKLLRPRICEQPRFKEWCNRFVGSARSQMHSALGSGVVVHPDGYILTNQHVIVGADEILVMFADGTTTTAQLVGSDSATDLAVIRVPLSGLTPISPGSSDDVEVGDVALAIGNPFGIGQTVSAGIISAKGRAGVSESPYDDFIQTDAAIHPGNSGGALIDSEGRLIGINTMIFSINGESSGVGFAIPAELTYSILAEIIATGTVTRGWLGVAVENTATSRGGVRISGVEQPGPAASAGLVPLDLVIAINDQPVMDPNQFSRTVGQTKPGEEIRLRIVRAGRELDIRVIAGTLPDQR